MTSGFWESVGVEMVKVVSSAFNSVKGPSTLHPLIVSFKVWDIVKAFPASGSSYQVALSPFDKFREYYKVDKKYVVM